MSSPWWRGERGEWYVAAQMVLLAAVAFAPAAVPGLPAWPAAVARLTRPAGMVSLAAGILFLLASALRLGSNLTPLPYPKPGGHLVVTGPYRLVRHPIYAGVLAAAVGWALYRCGWLPLAFAAALTLLLHVKSSREERWLIERFPQYEEYRRHVARFFPFLY